VPASARPDSVALKYGFDPGPFASKYSSGPGLLPGYDPTGAVESVYLERLNAGISADGTLNDAGDLVFTQIHNLVLRTGEQMIRELAGPVDEHALGETLERALNPEAFWLQMVTIDGRARPVRRDDFTPSAIDFEPQDLSSVGPNLPVFRSSDVEILETIRPRRAYKVKVDGLVGFCKNVGRGLELPAISRDCQVLQRIRATGLDLLVRVPRLEGLVSLGEGGQVIGFLTNYIETSSPFRDLDAFQDDIDAVAPLRRKKWAGQVEHTINQLHRLGVVWGDVSARNILIDRKDNLWAVDFGGGFNLNAELMNTKEGDLDGLSKLHTYLKV
jgi:hypothetical protein